MPYEYEYPRPAVSVDAVVFRNINDAPHLLLIQRKNEPYADCWALPGGFMDMDETADTAVARELLEETGLTANSVRQLYTFTAVERDPRTRVVSIAYLVEVANDAEPVAADDAKNAQWFPLQELPELAFDHAEMLQHGKAAASLK